ncbi:MAG: NUDIX hydrolase [Gemmatimonadetes bacterium]|nr:NUDIX hydrolase [Gemmatimonadota bacterium]
MAGDPRYCATCGGPLEGRINEGVLRHVCRACGAIHYRIPLPVAAAVVLNPAREVLLVKRRRPPHKGQWCLPTGFAEMAESIEAAALRELTEETGISGRVVRLLSAASAPSDFYDDLLFVCFEVERTGGEERSGDDAEALAWFPADRVPRLAFPAHEEAIARCFAQHRAEWAIQDSFSHLEGGGEALISDALVRLVEEHAEEISRRWLAVVRKGPTTPTYALLPSAMIQERAMTALSQFCCWLSGEKHAEEWATFYRLLGRQRREQGVALHEVLSALTLLKREIWSFIGERGGLVDLMEVYRAMELSRRVAVFFDNALYHTARGYDEE